MRVVALHAIHFAFDDGMMLRQMKLGVHVKVAFVARLWIFARIDDEFLCSETSGGDVFAGRSVTRFASRLTLHFRVAHVEPRMCAGGKSASDFGVAIGAG